MPLINFAGIASGIDSNALIDAISQATRQARVVPLEDDVSKLEDTNTSLDELKTKLRDLQTLIRTNFATISGGALTKLARSTDETIVTATAANGATNGTYSITPTQLAKNHTYTFRSTAGTYTSSTQAIASGLSGSHTVTITTGSPTVVETVNMTVTSTTTLSEFAANFNAASSKAEASVINVGTTASPDYRIIVTSSATGLENGYLNVSVGAGITAQNAFNNNSQDPATNSTFTITGISGTITRQTNSVSDVLPGVTFNLESVGSATTISIGDDVTATTAKVQDFIDSYNEIVEYIKEQNLIERQEEGDQVENIFGALASTRVDDNTLTSIRTEIVESAYDSGSTTQAIKIFADLGITTERDGTLKFDSTVLATAISKEPSNANEILKRFGDATATTGGTIDQYVRFNGLFDSTIEGNQSLIDNLNDRIAETEERIKRQEEILRQRYARLESLMGQLQGQQGALTSALGALGKG